MSDEEYSDIESVKSEIDAYPEKIIDQSKQLDNDYLADDADMSDNGSDENDELAEDEEEIPQTQMDSDDDGSDDDGSDDDGSNNDGSHDDGSNNEGNSDDNDDNGNDNTDVIPQQVKSKKVSEKKPKKKLMILDDDDDDDEEYNENYLEKFDSELVKNYIDDFHPECLSHNYDEISKMTNVIRNSDGLIIDPLHRTIPYLTKYEKARILGQRAKQIETGAKPLVKVPENIIDGYIIAELELKEKKIPFIIKRPIPGGACEYWNLKDLEVVIF